MPGKNKKQPTRTKLTRDESKEISSFLKQKVLFLPRSDIYGIKVDLWDYGSFNKLLKKNVRKIVDDKEKFTDKVHLQDELEVKVLTKTSNFVKEQSGTVEEKLSSIQKLKEYSEKQIQPLSDDEYRGLENVSRKVIDITNKQLLKEKEVSKDLDHQAKLEYILADLAFGNITGLPKREPTTEIPIEVIKETPIELQQDIDDGVLNDFTPDYLEKSNLDESDILPEEIISLENLKEGDLSDVLDSLVTPALIQAQLRERKGLLEELRASVVEKENGFAPTTAFDLDKRESSVRIVNEYFKKGSDDHQDVLLSNAKDAKKSVSKVNIYLKRQNKDLANFVDRVNKSKEISAAKTIEYVEKQDNDFIDFAQKLILSMTLSIHKSNEYVKKEGEDATGLIKDVFKAKEISIRKGNFFMDKQEKILTELFRHDLKLREASSKRRAEYIKRQDELIESLIQNDVKLKEISVRKSNEYIKKQDTDIFNVLVEGVKLQGKAISKKREYLRKEQEISANLIIGNLESEVNKILGGKVSDELSSRQQHRDRLKRIEDYTIKEGSDGANVSLGHFKTLKEQIEYFRGEFFEISSLRISKISDELRNTKMTLDQWRVYEPTLTERDYVLIGKILEDKFDSEYNLVTILSINEDLGINKNKRVSNAIFVYTKKLLNDWKEEYDSNLPYNQERLEDLERSYYYFKSSKMASNSIEVLASQNEDDMKKIVTNKFDASEKLNAREKLNFARLTTSTITDDSKYKVKVENNDGSIIVERKKSPEEKEKFRVQKNAMKATSKELNLLALSQPYFKNLLKEFKPLRNAQISLKLSKHIPSMRELKVLDKRINRESYDIFIKFLKGIMNQEGDIIQNLIFNSSTNKNLSITVRILLTLYLQKTILDWNDKYYSLITWNRDGKDKESDPNYYAFIGLQDANDAILEMIGSNYKNIDKIPPADDDSYTLDFVTSIRGKFLKS